MKIKVAYGVDTRLYRYNQTQEKPEEQLYQDLLAYICKTFQFADTKQFRITYKDEDDEMMTIADFQDFQEAFISTKQQNKKSLKLHIVNIPQNNPPPQEPEGINDDEKKESEPIQSTVNNENNSNARNEEDKAIPTPEEINAFLSDDLNIDLLSDLFVSVFEALSAAQFEITFVECLQGILLSDDGKYIKLTSNPIWPYFMEELIQKKAPKIEGFVIPMIKMNGGNTEMIKQWIPTMLSMLKMHSQNGGFNCWRGRGFRGRGGRGCRRRHHHNQYRRDYHHHGPHAHHNHRGRRGGRRGWRHHHNHNHHGQNNYGYNQHGFHHDAWIQAAPQQNQGVNGNNGDEDHIEAEAFEYTEELVAIMNMGFANMGKIKGLLIQHKGNKEIVVQELVGEKN